MAAAIVSMAASSYLIYLSKLAKKSTAHYIGAVWAVGVVLYAFMKVLKIFNS